MYPCSVVCCEFAERGEKNMAQRKLLTNGNAFKRTDNRWGGVVWYMDEQGERKRKPFSGTTKAEVNQKMTDYIANFTTEVAESDQARKPLKESIMVSFDFSAFAMLY